MTERDATDEGRTNDDTSSRGSAPDSPAPGDAALYRALQTKVDGFFTAVREADDGVACESGCAACCRAELSVNGVEASAIAAALRTLPDAVRGRVRERADTTSEEATASDAYCVMLDPDTLRCDIYAARPLVCRSQGLALAYPPGFVPEASIRAKGAVRDDATQREGPDITWCPLCYVDQPPAGAHILDAHTVDKTLALIEHRRLESGDFREGDEPPRYHLRALARASA